MADMREEQENQKQPEGGGKVGRFFKRLAVLCLTLLVVLGAVAVALLGEGKYLNRVRRWLIYGNGAAENLYSFAADPYNRYGQLDHYLVVLSQNHFQILESDGTAVFSQDVQLSQPALSVGEELAVAYDIGGSNLYVFSVDGVMLEQTMEEEYGLIAARFNDSDYLSVITEQSGYKGVVTVYNPEMQKVFAYRSSSQFLSDAVVSEDGETVTVVAMGQQDGGFCSQLIRYRLSETIADSETTLPGHLTLDIENMGESCASISDNEISFVDDAGSVAGSFTYGGLYLRNYTVSDGGFSALLLNRYRSGSIGTLVTVDGNGKAIAMQEITEEVMDISAAGEYLAVLYSDSMVIYNRDLEEQTVLEETGYADHILMKNDGSAIVIGGNTAWRYLP